MQTEFEILLDKAEKKRINEAEALYLFKKTENLSNAQKLFESAVKVRNKEIGSRFRWSGGIASVTPCKLQPLCAFCPYWTKDTSPLTMDEILEAVRYIEEQGITNFHLSGGTDLQSDGSDVVEIVTNILPHTSATITVNVGAALSKDNILKLRDLGVEKIGSSFETANPLLYDKFKSGDSFEAKKNLAEMINDAGLKFGTGMLSGLNKTPSRYEDYVDFIFFVKQYKNLDSVYVSRFFPVKGTPMEDHPRCSTLEGARIIAIMRLVLRDVDIGPAAGWSYDDIPVWVMAGGGNRIGGVHINRSPRYRNNWYLHSALDYHKNMEFCNTISTASRLLKESGIEVTF